MMSRLSLCVCACVCALVFGVKRGLLYEYTPTYRGHTQTGDVPVLQMACRGYFASFLGVLGGPTAKFLLHTKCPQFAVIERTMLCTRKFSKFRDRTNLLCCNGTGFTSHCHISQTVHKVKYQQSPRLVGFIRMSPVCMKDMYMCVGAVCVAHYCV